MVVCTLCSCYPWPVLGLPPVWYKSAPYRSRAVADPRGVLADFGVTLPKDTEIRIWDSTAEIRYLVVPMRPAGTDGWSEEKLAELVTRDSMIGTGLPKEPKDLKVTTAARISAAHTASVRSSRSQTNRCFTANGSDARSRSRSRWAGPAAGTSTCRGSRARTVRPGEYLSMSYYQIWLAGLETLHEGTRPGQRTTKSRPDIHLRPPKPAKCISSR